jgi:hypothetical protein
VLPGQRPPRLPARLGRFGTWRPLAPAAERLAFVPGVTGAAATGRRATARAGAAYEAGQTAAVETLARALPPAPFGPRVPFAQRRGGAGAVAAPGMGRGQAPGSRHGGHSRAGARGVGRASRAARLLVPSGPCGDLRALGPGGNTPARDRDGPACGCGARWGGGAPGVRRPPSASGGAPPGCSPGPALRGPGWAGGRWRAPDGLHALGGPPAPDMTPWQAGRGGGSPPAVGRSGHATGEARGGDDGAGAPGLSGAAPGHARRCLG